MEVRRSTNQDIGLIEALYQAAFPDENLLPLVRSLLDDDSLLLSLIGIEQGELIGHIAFTRCTLAEKNYSIALLGPLAVAPLMQKQGVGSGLVKKGLELLQGERIAQVQVLGDPNYYKRFGFRADSLVLPPYQLPEEWSEAWQAIRLDSGLQPLKGQLVVPSPWAQESLWLP